MKLPLRIKINLLDLDWFRVMQKTYPMQAFAHTKKVLNVTDTKVFLRYNQSYQIASAEVAKKFQN